MSRGVGQRIGRGVERGGGGRGIGLGVGQVGRLDGGVDERSD